MLWKVSTLPSLNERSRPVTAQTTSNRSALKLTLVLLCGGMLANSAKAGFTSIDNGNPNVGPAYYESWAIGSSTPFNIGGQYYFGLDEGTVITSNAAYSPASLNTTWTDTGATITARASTTPGGFFTSRNSASLAVTNAAAGDGYYAQGSYGSRTTVQFFSPQALAQSATFNWHVSGSQTPTVTGQCVPSSQIYNNCSTSRIDFLATTNPNATFGDVFTDPTALLRFGPGDFSYSIAGMPLNQTISLMYWTSAFVGVVPGQIAKGQKFSALADYSNTYDLLSIDLFDANNNLITDWTLLDLSTGTTVFNQNGRIPTSVPEPSAIMLLSFGLLGLLGLAFARRPLAIR